MTLTARMRPGGVPPDPSAARGAAPTDLRRRPVLRVLPALDPTLASLRQGAPAGVDQMMLRARSLWPRLDPRALRRSNGDPARIARLVARRSGLDLDTIVAMLRRGDAAPRATER